MMVASLVDETQIVTDLDDTFTPEQTELVHAMLLKAFRQGYDHAAEQHVAVFAEMVDRYRRRASLGLDPFAPPDSFDDG